jgi:hypothetical protein
MREFGIFLVLCVLNRSDLEEEYIQGKPLIIYLYQLCGRFLKDYLLIELDSFLVWKLSVHNMLITYVVSVIVA